MSDNNPQVNKPLIAAGIAGLCILIAIITAFFITFFMKLAKKEDTNPKSESAASGGKIETESEDAELGSAGAPEFGAGEQAYQVLMSLDDLTDDEVRDLYRDILDAYKQAWKDNFSNYDDAIINPNMTKSELGIPKNLSYAFIDFADDGFPELVVANVDKNGYKVIDLVGIEVNLQTSDRRKSAKRIFDQYPSKSFNLRLVNYLVPEDDDDESDSSESDSLEKKNNSNDSTDSTDSTDGEGEEERMNLLYTADWNPDSDVRMMDLDILNPRMIKTTSFMEIRRRPDLRDGEDEAYTIREGEEEVESVSEEKYTAVTYGIMENSSDYDVDWVPISDWKG